MATTTANYGFQKPAKGDQNWDVTLNKNFDDIDTRIKTRENDIANRYTKSESDVKYAVKTVTLSDNVDLNTVVTSGFYRLGNNPVNSPNNGVVLGQMIVSKGSDTIFQIITGYNNDNIYIGDKALAWVVQVLYGIHGVNSGMIITLIPLAIIQKMK